mgnify:CR=1 FL=1
MLSYKNYCFFDFETDSTNSNIANPLELSIMLVSYNRVLNLQKFKIHYPLKYYHCSESQKEALAFNEIYSQNDIDLHNQDSISIKDALNVFFVTIKNNFQKQDFILSGFNNNLYDNIILKRYLKEYQPQHLHFFLKQSLDIFDFIKSMSKDDRLDIDLRTDYFKSYENRIFTDYKQLTIYKCIFKTGFKAHDSLEDVKALYKIFKFYAKKFPHLINKYLSEQKDYYDMQEEFRQAYEVQIKC